MIELLSGTFNVCPFGMYLGCFWDEQVPYIQSSFILYLICIAGICFADYTGMKQNFPSWCSTFLLLGSILFSNCCQGFNAVENVDNL